MALTDGQRILQRTSSRIRCSEGIERSCGLPRRSHWTGTRQRHVCFTRRRLREKKRLIITGQYQLSLSEMSVLHLRCL